MADVVEKLPIREFDVAHEMIVEVLVKDEYVQISGLRTFKEASSNEIDTFYEFGEDGYSNSVKTGHKKSYNILATRYRDCEAQNAIAVAATKTGSGANLQFRVIGAAETEEFIGVVDLTDSGKSGDAIDLLKLEGVIHCTGKPKVTNKGYASDLRI